MTGHYSNWGRWGKEDERGTLNHVTPEITARAAALVRQGKIYSLALPLQQFKVPQVPLRSPNMHMMTMDGGDYAAGQRAAGGCQIADDYIFMPTHGTTHMDALAHVFYDGQLYNGFPSTTVRSTGARHCSVDKVGGIVTRGVLLDVAAWRGVEHLPADYTITPADLDACAVSQGVTVGSGDALLLRTGWLEHFATDPHTWHDAQPGIGEACIPWLYEKQVALMAADNTAVERMPAEDPTRYLPVHMNLLRDQGMTLMELFRLDEIARDRLYEFCFVAAPLRITGGVGSPLNPLAIC